jgi:homoserine kinase type II
MPAQLAAAGSGPLAVLAEMAVFTALTEFEVERLLQQYSLGHLRALQGISSGIENSNFFLTAEAGEFVLTVFERLTFAQLPFYLELMQHLARRDLPVPAPRETRAGTLMAEARGKPVAIVDRLPGRWVAAPSATQCATMGDLLARMHLAASDFPRFQPNLRGIGWWKDALAQLEPKLPDPIFHELAEEVIFQDSFFRSSAFEECPSGPIHADLFRDNVLWEDNRIGGVIDFYFAGCSLWLYDLAVVVNDWCVDLATAEFDPPRARALLDAYHAVRPLTALERECWRTALRAAALRFWISRLYDLHLPRDAHTLTPHDPTRFEITLRKRRAGTALPWPT